MNIRQLYIIFLILFFKCASSPVSDTLDDWKKQQSKRYWYGIGIVDKKEQVDNLQESARNRAIAQIASQIKIKLCE